jgi:DNA-binding transcriptional LysR family regulator
VRTGVELTESGHVVFQHAEQIFHDVDRIRDSLQAIEHQVRGQLTIGTVNSIGIYLLPDMIKDFSEAYPEIKVGIEFKQPRELAERVRAGRTDFAILTHNRRYAGLIAVPLQKSKMFLVVPPEHPLARGEDISPRDLEKHPFIGFEEGQETRTMIDALFKRMALRIEYMMESSNVATIKHMVMAGLGVAILPEHSVGEEIRRGLLVRPSLPSMYMTQEVTLYYKTNRTLTPTKQEFLDFMRRELGIERPLKR